MRPTLPALLLLGASLATLGEPVASHQPDETSVDTLDFWHVYHEGEIVLRSNAASAADSVPVFVLPSGSNTGTLGVVYFTDAPRSGATENLSVYAAEDTLRQKSLLSLEKQRANGLRLRSPLENPFVVALRKIETDACPCLFVYSTTHGKRQNLFQLLHE